MTRYEVKDEYTPEVAREVRLTGFANSPEGATIIGNPMNGLANRLGDPAALDNNEKPTNGQGKKHLL